MSQIVCITSQRKLPLLSALGSVLSESQCSAIGIASAFVSCAGVQSIRGVLQEYGIERCRLVAGTDSAITHPEALYAALDYGWQLRLGSCRGGIFHPKLIVAGQRFRSDGGVTRVSTVYVGSANLTSGGLRANVECGLVASSGDCLESGANAFAELWSGSRPATARELRNYSARFAELAQSRTPKHLEDIGVAETSSTGIADRELMTRELPHRPSVRPIFASAAWAGLQSFTGDYRFQVEFPRAAGEVLGGIVRRQGGREGNIDVYCPDDGETRSMSFRFYQDNSMFRLNIPNDTPGADWARAKHEGIAIVETGPAGGARMRLRILRPGPELQEVLGRSVALGTWGRTTTRLYGWF
jgi:HKD family nuclease